MKLLPLNAQIAAVLGPSGRAARTAAWAPGTRYVLARRLINRDLLIPFGSARGLLLFLAPFGLISRASVFRRATNLRNSAAVGARLRAARVAAQHGMTPAKLALLRITGRNLVNNVFTPELQDMAARINAPQFTPGFTARDYGK